MSFKRALQKVTVPSTTFTTEAYFDGQGAAPAIRFGYSQEGASHLGGFQFTKVLAVRTRAERCCQPWHIEGVYDTLAEIEDSQWVEELRADTTEQWRGTW